MDTSRKAKIFLVTGASGSGKSSIVKKLMQHEKRVIAFDPDDEYSEEKGFNTSKSCTELLEKVLATKGGAMKTRVVARTPEAFGACASVAFEWGNCAFIAEELAGEGRTTPSKAPPDWHKIISRGRKRGINVIGVTQRPAESDKTILGNASHIFVGRMGRHADAKAISREIDVPVETLLNLKNLEFVVVDKNEQTKEFLDVRTMTRKKL